MYFFLFQLCNKFVNSQSLISSVYTTTELLTPCLQITSVCADTDQAYYDLIVKKASALLSSVQVNMLKLALSLRAYSATVHSFQQVPAG